MFTQEDHQFIDFLFNQLITHTDTDMIDLQNDDSCDDHLQFSQLELYGPNNGVFFIIHKQLIITS